MANQTCMVVPVVTTAVAAAGAVTAVVAPAVVKVKVALVVV